MGVGSEWGMNESFKLTRQQNTQVGTDAFMTLEMFRSGRSDLGYGEPI